MISKLYFNQGMKFIYYLCLNQTVSISFTIHRFYVHVFETFSSNICPLNGEFRNWLLIVEHIATCKALFNFSIQSHQFIELDLVPLLRLPQKAKFFYSLTAH